MFLDYLKPDFDRLTDIELLSKCQLGLTQIQMKAVTEYCGPNVKKLFFVARKDCY